MSLFSAVGGGKCWRLSKVLEIILHVSFSIESVTYSVDGREHSCFNIVFHSCGIADRQQQQHFISHSITWFVRNVLNN